MGDFPIKFFANNEDLQLYLKKKKGKTCKDTKPVFAVENIKNMQIHKYEN